MKRLSDTVPGLPLAGMCAALALAVLPIASQAAGWAVAGFGAALAARLLLHRRAARLPSTPVKLLLLAAGVGVVAARFGTLVGPAPGLSVLLVLIALKVLETQRARDLQVLALVGYFLCLCGLFSSQELLLWVGLAGIAGLITATLLFFHRGGQRASIGPAARTSGLLLAQALPLALLLFVLLPRATSSFRFQFGRSILGQQGMSDRLDPGSVAGLVRSDEVVFRVEFPGDAVPSLYGMYWRGMVLWQCDGLRWSRGEHLSMERSPRQLAGGVVAQRISLQPHGAHWLFALDRPRGETRGAILQPGGYLQSVRPIFQTLHYAVESQPENREARLPLDHVSAALALPPDLSPAVRALAASWTATARSGREIVAAAQRHFRTERFSYSLEPGTYGEDGLEDFLFRRREGFCEHYAAAFATLMRAAGLPARVVAGYHGGQFNDVGHYMIVRQYHAHAWCEVWLAGSGWVRVDPSDSIAPERMRSPLGGADGRRATEPGALAGGTGAHGWWRLGASQLAFAWDAINYRWDLHVQSYDEDQQRTLLSLLGFRDFRWTTLLLWSGGAGLLLLALLALVQRRPRRPPPDPIVAPYAQLCRRLAAAGLSRAAAEGPQRFIERAAGTWPEHAPALRHCGALYTALRYGPAPGSPRELAAAVRALPDFPRLSPVATGDSMPAPPP